MRNQYGLKMVSMGQLFGVAHSTVFRWEASETVVCDPRHMQLLLLMAKQPVEERKQKGERLAEELLLHGDLAALKMLLSWEVA
jgi:hypothetical protein